MTYVIETVNLTKRFRQSKRYKDIFLQPFINHEITVLDKVNIQVEKGEIFGLIGPNGAGKTTFIKILCTLILPTGGEAFVAGYNIKKESENVRRNIGYIISDERSFYWRLTGYQNLEFFATLNNLGLLEVRHQINKVLEFIGLEKSANVMFQKYSTGMKQRLSIARALLTNPQILFMDEPTKSLDPTIAKTLWEFIETKIVKEEKKTVFFATHNLSEAATYTDKLAIIDKGRICKILDKVKERYIAKKPLQEIWHTLLEGNA